MNAFFLVHMFTRHLYEADEVLAALRWSIRQGRTQEALFWCFELIESEMQEKLKEELYASWIWLFGISCLSALPLLQEETYSEFVYALARLPKERRDRSVLMLLLLGSQDKEQPDRINSVNQVDSIVSEQGCNALEAALLSALYQGKSRLAFDLSRPLWQENPVRVFTLLQRVQEKKHRSLLSEVLTLLEFQTEDVWATRACAIASVCLDTKRLQISLQPLSCQLTPSLVAAIHEWKEGKGRRASRIYPIPRESLYNSTKRGLLSNKETTLERLYTVSEESLAGCPFWDRVLEEEIPWLDDDRKEAFYDQYFPDDIPDEWSKADQEKSHGYGCLINQEVPNYQKYVDRWYRDLPTRAYWCNNRDMQRWVTDTWKSHLDQPWSELVSTWCLTPVKRRVLVVET
jgi:hypothetical protein